MKNHKTIMFAAASLFCLDAIAQSSVTVYGIIDDGITFSSNAAGGRQYALSSGVISGSRWGFRGSEEIGGGLKAVFQLENGFDVNSGKLGQGGLEFGRTSMVGVLTKYGTVTLGRQYDALVDSVGLLAVADQWAGYYAAHPGDVDNFNNSFRANNSVKYVSPSLGGLTFEGLYSFGGTSGDFSRNQLISLGAVYSNGPLVAGAGYINARNPNIGAFGNSSTTTPTAAVNAITSPISSGFASAHTYQSVGLAAAYTFGATTVGANYSNVRFFSLGDLASGPNPLKLNGTATFNSAEVSLKYQVTPALLAAVAYDFTAGSGTSDAAYGAHYNQGEAALDYFLSKRTDISFLALYQRASGVDSTGTAARAYLNFMTPSSNDRVFVARIGVRHKF